MLEYLKENLLVLLFIVIAIGYLIGRIRYKGFSLGVSAVLFVGIAIGSLHPDFKLPDILYILGLVLFVYTIGLSSGPGFFSSFNREGLAVNVAVIFVITMTALLTIGMSFFVQIKGSILAGLFCGSLTNTPALATLVDIIKETNGTMSNVNLTQALSEPVIGYSISYPFGVIGVILGFFLYKKIFNINISEEAKSIETKMGLGGEDLVNVRVIVTEEKLIGWSIREIFKAKNLSGVIISRIQRNKSKHEDIVDGDTLLANNDILTLVGTKQEIDKGISIFGEKVEVLESSHKNDDLDYRRILVSHPDAIGIPLHQLNLHKTFRATITRIKRGDVDFVPRDSTRLQAGDRIRVVATRNDLKQVAKFFGDSFSTISHIDYISMSIGIALGLLLGSIAIPLPGGEQFKLGFAGGPLVVALFLGKIGRTGKFIWTMSYNANLTVNQLGVVLFLAGIGLKAGYSFGENVKAYGLILLSMGIIITTFSTVLMLFIGKKFLRIPYPLLVGVISGMQTQPAVLAYSNEEIKNSAPNLGYAMVFPTAMIMKIILVRIIYKFLQ